MGTDRAPTTTSARRGWGQRVLDALPNSVWLPLVMALIGASVFVGVRVAWAGEGDVSRFVAAGSVFTTPSEAPPNLHVNSGFGYDGQLFYRLALDPLEVDTVANGIRIDLPIRTQRIAYPMLAYVASGGTDAAVPWALVIVNVVGLAALGGLGGLVAKQSGRHAIYGLWFAVFFGYVFTLSRDLSEITEAAFVLGGLLALRRERWGLAAVLLSGAVLTREQALLVVGAVGLCRVVEMVRSRVRPGAQDVAWIAPMGAFVAWQAYCRIDTGVVPMFEAGEGDQGITFPFADLIDAVPGLIRQLDSGTGLLHLGEVVVMLGIIGLAIVALRSTTAPVQERVAFVLLVVFMFTVATGTNVWHERFDLRPLADLYVVAGLVLFGTRLPVVAPGVLVAGSTAAAAALRVSTV
ncbi:MAG: hypothetical protein FJW86_09115 [Actinobacteria bacterium]|nr:hypothetical protein [Actinomycetota bacterium]